MDRFDHYIAALKPKQAQLALDGSVFIAKLERAKHQKRLQTVTICFVLISILLTLIGAVRRDIWEVIKLTIHYVSDVPLLPGRFVNAYIASVSWAGMASAGLAVALVIAMIRNMRNSRSLQANRMISLVAVIAVLFAGVGMISGSTQAAAAQQALKRSLNERGHVEVAVNGKKYELNPRTQVTDSSIEKQALIASLRYFDISRAYPMLGQLQSDGMVAEIRSVNTRGGCAFYTERRLEPAFNKIGDASSGCITSDMPVYYLTQDLKPTKAPQWQKGQAIYMTSAKDKTKTNNPNNPMAGLVGIVVLLSGKADGYVAQQNNQQIVPKDSPSAGTHGCGIDRADECPNTDMIDVLFNFQTQPANRGDTGSAVLLYTYRPSSGAGSIDVYGKILAMDSAKLQVRIQNGQQWTIYWPENYLAQFNATGAKNYTYGSTPFAVTLGDTLDIRIGYRQGMDMQHLSVTDVSYMGVALKTTMPDPLSDEAYSKDKAGTVEKY